MRRQGLSFRRLLAVALLSLAAVWSTLHSPTIFFDNQILLGPSLGVFALLRFGWAGLPVGIAAALATVILWGHPWAALLLMLQLLWQQLFLSRFNGSPEEVTNGRIVLATIVFWLVLGGPLTALLYTRLLATDPGTIGALALKEAVVSVANAGLALGLVLLLQLRPRQRSAWRMRAWPSGWSCCCSCVRGSCVRGSCVRGTASAATSPCGVRPSPP